MQWRGFGRSTSTEVDALIKKFPALKAGDKISYEEIAKVANSEKGTSRFNAVAGAWRKRLDVEFNIVLKAISNEGFVVMANASRIGHSAKGVKHGLRKIDRSSRLAARTDDDGLTESERKIKDHLARIGASLITLSQVESKKLSYVLREVQKKID